MTKLIRRLRDLEQAVPEPEKPSELARLAAYLVGFELHRLHRIVARAVEEGGGQFVSPQDKAEHDHLLGMALERQLASWQTGWDSPDMEHLKAADSAKSSAVWRLIFALRRRHSGLFFTQLCDAVYCDLLDVEAREIDELIELVKRASCREDIKAFEPVIGRLRMGDHPISLEEFDRLVFRGELPRGNADS